MLCEIECRALSTAHTRLIHDFEPRDALTYLEGKNIFTEDHSELISKMSTRLERIANFLRIYRRQASELGPLIDFFNYNNQSHLADFLEDYIDFAINEPDLLRPVVIAPQFSRQMLDRKLLLGNVPKQMTCYIREYHVDRVIKKLDEMCDLDSFFLFLHGRAGSGKSVIASQALSKSDQLIGINYDSIVWLKDSGTAPKSTFDLFTDILLMLKSEDDLLNFPSVEHVTSVVLKRMICNALIDRPNTLFVFDDVVQEETIRWAQELRLRCLVTTRDVEISNAASQTCEFIEVTSLEIDECYDFLEAYGMPMPVGEKEEDVLNKTIELSSGNPATLMMFFKSCEPKTFEKMAQLNNKLESRGLVGVECITPYSYKSLAMALQRCVEVLSDEDRSALAFAVVMPPGVDIPVKLWSCVIPVDICSNEEEQLDDEVADRLKRLSKRGALLSGKRMPVLTFKIDHIIHMFLKHVVDAQTIANGISILEQRLLEIGNNNVSVPERHIPSHFQKFRRSSASEMYPKTTEETVIRPEDFPKFMQLHQKFYDSLKNFACC
ncbi:Cell death protein 4 [Caenorhabditis elegans]|uniref:Cell death protein 4 n=1 Tax=Caenorhabditis elegans TaxID=6239 RepID=CED4_CAEEL|nr:Cell death protein 4 [Caenorhabditis elegans]2A5Y_B Chain B, ced-4 [Caenorhabditis elegans]2A5Y_C Chain C, ced-4 [Caenorhabditis elegans]3LQQ_A Chain A, Cell death protein 4 [Caenorhabditis elegans]3LQQ_B Chain B, Cell death protein 4 [Caenorhabditis elegans]3LQR_A Chain A, Cell death protein 4 [Caenorhabditis elegans]3LQR_B Chain B, Cell death protein 4 [Caenorhabditis elegans]4M9X_A Chain A, Cell death protein 4 [Caenorhabditis elegans]4M9X_B Chain B, Cell death protein 4 [Caenorhabdit|eukprot:NP_001021202.1 Cell death protein 4 [Caenorhabditis elegans]